MAVVSSAVMTLVPESKLKGAYKTLSMLLVMFTLFTAFSSVDTDISESMNYYVKESSFYSEKTDEILLSEGEAIISRELENKLYEGGIKGTCSVRLRKECEEFRVSSVKLYGSFSEKDKKEAKNIIHLYFKEECKVIFAEESNAE